MNCITRHILSAWKEKIHMYALDYLVVRFARAEKTKAYRKRNLPL